MTVERRATIKCPKCKHEFGIRDITKAGNEAWMKLSDTIELTLENISSVVAEGMEDVQNRANEFWKGLKK